MLKIGKLCILKDSCPNSTFGMYKSLNPPRDLESKYPSEDNHLGFFVSEELQKQPFLLLEIEKNSSYPWIKVLIENKIGWIGIDTEELDEFKG
jgi:hypothetical protein